MPLETVSELLKLLNGFSFPKIINCLKKKYYKWKFGPKAKSKNGFRLGRIKEEKSNKVYIVDAANKKYYWIKTKKILSELGYAISDANEEILSNQVSDYKQGNPIYWE